MLLLNYSRNIPRNLLKQHEFLSETQCLCVCIILADGFINTMQGQFSKQKMYLVTGSMEQEGYATVKCLTLVVSLLLSIILLLKPLSQLQQLQHTEKTSFMAMCVCVFFCKLEYGNGPQYRYFSESDQSVQPQLLRFFSVHEVL
jgi:hypothetical protein